MEDQLSFADKVKIKLRGVKDHYNRNSKKYQFGTTAALAFAAGVKTSKYVRKSTDDADKVAQMEKEPIKKQQSNQA